MLRLFVLTLLLVGLAPAAAQDVFTVAEVPVAAEAKSAGEAQKLARDQGRRRALDLLFRRLVAEEDWIYLPNLAEAEPASAAVDAAAMQDPRYDVYDPTIDAEERVVRSKQAITLTEAEIEGFELETNVFDEKSSGTTYRASITYRFKPEAVRATLQSARLPYSEEQARMVLILPVLVTENDTYLWEPNNPWARAWLERPLTNELTPMELPRGDIIDVQTITADEAADLNAAALRAFAERYPSDKLYLALARLREQGNEFRLQVKLIDATPPRLDMSGGQTSAIGTEVVDLFFRGADDDFPALARRAVQSTVQRHASAWKRRTLVDYSLKRTFQLTAWFQGQKELTHIQSAIDSSALVQGRETRALNLENAIWVLTVVGEEDQFRLAMRERDLEVWQDTTGRWHIAELDLAAELKARMEPLTTDIDKEVEQRRGFGRIFGRGNRSPEKQPSDESDVPELPDDLFGDSDN